MDEVLNWLRSIGLQQYVTAFENDSWERIEDLLHIDEENLKKCIQRPGHRKIFHRAVQGTQMLSGKYTLIKGKTDLCNIDNAKKVENWLRANGLGEYSEHFKEDGWDIPVILNDMDENDIQRCIHKPGHRQKFKLALKRFNFSYTYPVDFSVEEPQLNKQQVEAWLKGNGLDQYFAKLESHGWDTLEVLFKLSENDDDLKQCIDKPGHSKRFQLEVAKEKSKVKQNEMLVAKALKESLDPQAENKTEHSSDENGVNNMQLHSGGKVDTLYSQEVAQERSTDIEIGGSSNPKESLDRIPKPEDKPMRRSYSFQSTTPASAMFVKIKDLRNLSLGGKIIDHSKTVSAKDKQETRDNFRKQMETVIEVAKEKDSLIVETSAYRELEKRVDNTHWGVVIGVPGDGKTSLAMHLSLKYHKKKYEHLELHSAREWKHYVDGSSRRDNGKKQFILIDDIFGRMNVDERKVTKWSSIIDLMQKVVKQRNGCLKVVCTSRKYVFEDVKTKLALFSSFQESSVIDMTHAEFSLAKDEKIRIWNGYERKFNLGIEMPQFLGEEMSNPHGFPHCVDLYFNSDSLRKDVSLEFFFENPMQSICKELNNFKDNAKIKYFALLLVLFNNNNLADVFIETVTSNELEFKAVTNAVGLSSLPTSTDLRKALKGLTGTYITELDSCYSISHDSIRENLAFVFISQNPVYAIQKMDFDYLTDHTTCSGQPVTDKPRLIRQLKPQYYRFLVERMLNEIQRGNVLTVCAHQAWDENHFVDDFINCLLGMPKGVDKEQCGYVFNTKDSSTSYIFDFSLFDALRFFGHKEAIKQMLQREELETLLDQFQGQIETPLEEEFERSLSLKLYRIMDNIGASEVLRKFQIHSATAMEVLDTVCAYIADEAFSCYIFGSHSEGTRIITHIPKRDCDVNYIFCLRNIEVVQSVADISPYQKVQQYLLAVTDEITMPGYVKLQFIEDGVPQTKCQSYEEMPEDSAIDHQDRIVVCKKRPEKIHIDENKGLTATTEIVTGTNYEIHYSYRCRSWPKIATKWISRNRHYNWPSRSVIEQIKSLGVFLVPVGSQGSLEKHLEWKILFLLQERLLMSGLNDTQYKCYIILKMINNDIISRHFVDPVLVSYHLKTCMFYVIENTRTDLWIPERLLDCVQVCLKRISQCVTEGYCPNYFIPQENLFYGRVRGELQMKLTTVLSELLVSQVKFWYFPMLQCGNLGPRLTQDIFGMERNENTDRDLVPSTARLYLRLTKFMSLVKMRILYKCYDPDIDKCIRLHFYEAVGKLREATEIIDHSQEQTKETFSLVLPHVELSLMSVLMVKKMEESLTSNKAYISNLLLSIKWKEIGLSIPVRLKQATFLYMNGDLHASLAVLQPLEQSLDPTMISVCGCKYHHTIVGKEMENRVKYMSASEFRKNMCVSCVAFLPIEEKLIPNVLRYEMCRHKVVSSNQNESPFRFWYKWAVVDGKVLLQLLLYLNYKNACEDNQHAIFSGIPVDKWRRKASVINKLDEILEFDPNLGHKETGLNILGWIYGKEGDDEQAERCFRKSLELQEEYNAANKHMEELMLVREEADT